MRGRKELEVQRSRLGAKRVEKVERSKKKEMEVPREWGH